MFHEVENFLGQIITIESCNINLYSYGIKMTFIRGVDKRHNSRYEQKQLKLARNIF